MTWSLDGLSELTTRQNPNPSILKLFYGSDTMLREKEILINLQKEETYIFILSCYEKKEIELESN